MALSALLMVVAAIIVVSQRIPGWLLSRSGSVVWLASAFAAWSCCSLLWSQASSTTLLTIALPLAGWLALLVAASMQVNLRHRVEQLLLAIGLVLVVLSVSQTMRMDGIRPYGFMYNTNNHAALINLFLLPLCARFLTLQITRERIVHGVGIAVLALVVGLAQSRGALLGLGVGLLIVMAAGCMRGQWQRCLQMSGWIVLGFILAMLFQEGSIAERLQTTEHQLWSSMDAATSSRLVIWESAWNIYLQKPLLGWGVGTFWAVYPQYKLPFESSAGQHVHNDYLELLVELGPIGLLLLLLVGLALLWQGLRLISRGGPIGSEASGLLAAIAAVSVHTFFTFNFYVMPIVLVIGLYVGWLSAMACDADALASNRAIVRRVVGQGRIAIVGVLIAVMVWLLTLFVSEYHLLRLGERGGAGEALHDIQRIGRLFPGRDTADLLTATQIISALNEGAVVDEQREPVIRYALDALERGYAKFPLRWENPLYRAQLMRLLNGEFSPEQIGQSYREALRLNPAFLRARIEYADYLYTLERGSDAEKLLEAGWGRYYHDHGAVIAAYLGLVNKSRRNQGDEVGADQALQLQKRVLAILEGASYNTFNFVIK